MQRTSIVTAHSLLQVMRLTDGRVVSSGLNDSAQLGISQRRGRPDPHDVECTSFFTVIPGMTNSLIPIVIRLCSPKRVNVFITNKRTVYSCRMCEELTGLSIATISCGFDHVLCLTSEGKVWSWGEASSGQLGRREGEVRRLCVWSWGEERGDRKSECVMSVAHAHVFVVSDEMRACACRNLYVVFECCFIVCA
jgi:alpha-tubulin suppressor-like RCC1 family protein